MVFITFSVELDKDIRFLMKLSIHVYLLHRNRIKLHPPVDFGGRFCERKAFWETSHNFVLSAYRYHSSRKKYWNVWHCIQVVFYCSYETTWFHNSHPYESFKWICWLYWVICKKKKKNSIETFETFFPLFYDSQATVIYNGFQLRPQFATQTAVTKKLGMQS